MAESSSTSSLDLERRTVVSVLIFPHQPYASKPYRVLLFRRSEKVRTYRNKLSPIAGSVESDDKNPLAAAWRELKEETGFGPEQLELWRRGTGFEFTDETAVSGRDSGKRRGRIWKVWPFAFRLTEKVADLDDDVDKLGLNLDWEHTGCEWRDIAEIFSGKIRDDCVPKLEVTLGQLWVSPETMLYRGLEELRLDHQHGARELATTALGILVGIVKEHQAQLLSEDTGTWWSTFKKQAFQLAFNGRPSMGAAISSAIATAIQDAEQNSATASSNALDKVQKSLELSIEHRRRISEQVSDQFSKCVHDKLNGSRHAQTMAPRVIKILTLSSSSTIKAAILRAFDADETMSMELRVLESRPLNEGVNFAKALTDEAQRREVSEHAGIRFKSRLRIVLASDASVGILGQGIDLVVIGADRISETGDVSNKTGSLAAVTVCKAISNDLVDVVCVSDSEKIAIPGTLDEHAEENNDEAELSTSWNLQRSAAWNDMVRISNVYFEWVPAKYIDHYICEHGRLSTQDICKRSKATAELLEKVFPPEQI